MENIIPHRMGAPATLDELVKVRAWRSPRTNVEAQRAAVANVRWACSTLSATGCVTSKAAIVAMLWDDNLSSVVGGRTLKPKPYAMDEPAIAAEVQIFLAPLTLTSVLVIPDGADEVSKRSA